MVDQAEKTLSVLQPSRFPEIKGGGLRHTELDRKMLGEDAR